MHNYNSNGSRAASARGFMALFAILLAMGLGLMACPAEAQPFAYVANNGDGTVSVINTATNPPTVVATVRVGAGTSGVAITPDGKHAYVTNGGFFPNGIVSVIDTATNPPTVVATVPVGVRPRGVAITPDGQHAYVTNHGAPACCGGDVSVIATATNTVVATVGVGEFPTGVAVTPDGKHAYVTGLAAGPGDPGLISVIDTATNTVVANVSVGSLPQLVAITPDGKHAYVANARDNNVSVIDTATTPPAVVATVPVGSSPFGVAITPNGTHAYVTNQLSNTVSVIDTASNTVVATVGVGAGQLGVAITPDGKHAYVTNGGFFPNGIVSVIDTASNTVVATVAVGNFPIGVGIVPPPPPGVPFLAFNAKLEIDLDRKPNEDRFELKSSFTLSSTAPAINPFTEAVTLKVGTFATTIPPGSFKKHRDDDEHGDFSFEGVIDGVRLEALIKRTGTLRFAFEAEARDANLAGTKNPVPVTLTIGGNSGTASVTAKISR